MFGCFLEIILNDYKFLKEMNGRWDCWQQNG